MSEQCRNDATLRELLASWHRLTPEVRAAIMQLVRSQRLTMRVGSQPGRRHHGEAD
jgi:hypothetical protein